MFNNLVECAKTKKDNKRWAYFMVTSTIWALALTGSIVGGIFIYDAKLDEQLSLLTFLNPLPPPAAAPVGSKTNPTPATEPKFAPPDMPMKKAPTEISNDVTNRPATRLVSSSSTDFSDLPGGGTNDGIDDGKGFNIGIPGGDPNVEAPAPAPKPVEIKELKVAEPIAKPQILRRSEGVIRGNTLSQVKPEYPALARNTSVSGDVKIEVLISEDGSVISANVLSGHALLQQAALRAAKQWRFNPTMLNNSPVKVQGVLTFRFTL